MLEHEDRKKIDQGRKTETLGPWIPILIAGLPGKMATLVAEKIIQTEGYDLLPFAITSKKHTGETIRLSGQQVRLFDSLPFNFPLDGRGGIRTIAVDYTTPQSAVDNAVRYAQLRMPFVLGTTGGNRQEIEQLVRGSQISAVIAPNMAFEVVAIQDELKELEETSPNAYDGWHMSIRESHQSRKRDVSGTAIAFQVQLEKLGAIMDGEIESIRDPKVQRQLGIQNVDGHAFHWITLTSPAGETKEYRTAIEGRRPYVEGTLMAIAFLNRKIREGSQGEVFTMSDVIRERRII